MYSIWDRLSEIGFVLGWSAMEVNPDLEATLKPLAIVSLSSYPGSPKDTLESNQPLETWRLVKLISL